MKKAKLFLSTSGVSSIVKGYQTPVYMAALQCFPPNQQLDIKRAVEQIDFLGKQALKEMKVAVVPAGNSEFTQGKIASDLESLQQAYQASLSGHNNKHELYNLFNSLRNRVELEIRKEFPLASLVEMFAYLDVICKHFIEQNKGIDLISDYIFTDGQKFKRNSTLLLAQQKRLEQQIAENID